MEARNLILITVIAAQSLAISARALQPEVLYAFGSGGPRYPLGGLIQGTDGNFYGTTSSGGISDNGTVFKVSATGEMVMLTSFNGTNGAYPIGALIMGNDSNFYGVTAAGGANGNGTVFKATANGALTTLASFNGTNGANAQAGLVLAVDGSFCGTTSGGGSKDAGTVFNVTTNGVLTSLVSFNGINGSLPVAPLVVGNDGNFYGTTAYGGRFSWGSVFKMTPNGELTTLASFNRTNGINPHGLVSGMDGNFYGTTGVGGSGYVDYDNPGAGTAFKISPNGTLTTLVSFSGTNGFVPNAPMVIGIDGNFYGTTLWGGIDNITNTGSGTMFKLAPDGTLSTLVLFNGANGSEPNGLVLGKDGNIFGTSTGGGGGGGGTIFRLVLPRLGSLVREPGGSFIIRGTGPAHDSYRLWASTDLSLRLGAWTLMTSGSFDSTGCFSLTDASAPTNTSRFYRIYVP
ncbi:MAG: choice-of-anchor tandem repeat GloVer-containing protein [Verrucomicrobiota bacterium]